MSDESTGTEMDDQAQRQEPQQDGEKAQAVESPETGAANAAESVTREAAATEATEQNPPADEAAPASSPNDAVRAADSALAEHEARDQLGVGPEVELDYEEPAQAKSETRDEVTGPDSEEQPQAATDANAESSAALGGFEPVRPAAGSTADELGLDDEDSASADFTDHAVMEILSDCIHMASQPPPPVSDEKADAANDDTESRTGASSAAVALPPPPGTPRIDMLDADDDEDEDEDAAHRYGVSSSSAPVTLARHSKGGAKVAIVPPATESAGPGWPTVVVGTVAASVLTLALVWGAMSSGVLSPPSKDEQQPNETAAASELAADVDPNQEQAAAPGVGRVGEPATRAPAAEQPPPGDATEQLEPQSAEAPQPAGTAGPFNRNAAADALSKATTRAERCSYPPERQSGRVSVTFTNDGRATKVYVLPGPFAGTPAAWCIAQVFRAIKIAPFEGEPVTLLRRITLSPLPKASRRTAPKAAEPADDTTSMPPTL